MPPRADRQRGDTDPTDCDVQEPKMEDRRRKSHNRNTNKDPSSRPSRQLGSASNKGKGVRRSNSGEQGAERPRITLNEAIAEQRHLKDGSGPPGDFFSTHNNNDLIQETPADPMTRPRRGGKKPTNMPLRSKSDTDCTGGMPIRAGGKGKGVRRSISAEEGADRPRITLNGAIAERRHIKDGSGPLGDFFSQLTNNDAIQAIPADPVTTRPKQRRGGTKPTNMPRRSKSDTDCTGGKPIRSGGRRPPPDPRNTSRVPPRRSHSNDGMRAPPRRSVSEDGGRIGPTTTRRGSRRPEPMGMQDHSLPGGQRRRSRMANTAKSSILRNQLVSALTPLGESQAAQERQTTRARRAGAPRTSNRADRFKRGRGFLEEAEDSDHNSDSENTNNDHSHGEVDIDIDDEVDVSDEDSEEEDQAPVSRAVKMLADAQKKKAMFMTARNNFASSRKMPSVLDNHNIADTFEQVENDEHGNPLHYNFLIEIVCARMLLVGDYTTSDPYVMIKLGDRDIHKTAKILKTLNPNWGPEHRNTFLLSCKSQELFDQRGLKLSVWDWDLIGSGDPLGDAFVPAQELIDGRGQVKMYKIEPPEELEGANAGTITIRSRMATKDDYESLKANEHKSLFPSMVDTTISKLGLPESLSIWIEIRSARNVLIADDTTSDPYVMVQLGHQDIHKTSKVLKTLNPDWTAELKSTFVLNCTAKKLFSAGGLLFKVWDWDFIGGGDPLGSLWLDADKLCRDNCLQEYQLHPPKDREKEDAGKLTLHYRKATEADLELSKTSKHLKWITIN